MAHAGGSSFLIPLPFEPFTYRGRSISRSFLGRCRRCVLYPAEFESLPSSRQLVHLVGKWLDTHHSVGGKLDGNDFHVFAVEHGAVFGKAGAVKTFQIVLHLGPVTVRVIPRFLLILLRRATDSQSL